MVEKIKKIKGTRKGKEMNNQASIPLHHRVGRVCLGGILAASVVGAGAFSLPTQAYAADGSVTITSSDNPSATYSAYQFFTADIDDQNNATHITWGEHVDSSALITFLNTYDYQTWITDNNKGPADNAQNAAEFISSCISSSTGANSPTWVDSDTFADNLAHWASENLTASGTATAANAYSDSEGYYLFVSSNVSADGGIGTAPIWFALGGSATTVEEKASVPTIDKVILESGSQTNITDIEISDTVTYQITTTLPGNYHTFDSFYYKVSDAVPEGMTIETGDVAVSHNDTDITSQFDIAVSDANLLTVTAEDLKALSEEFASGDTITITYTVDLNNLGDMVFGGTGNINGASLEYSNDPYSDTHGTIEPDDTYVYTYQISIDKTDASTGVPLEGAQFIIQNAEGKYLAQSGDTYAWSADQAGATKFTTNAQGAIAQIPGLDAGTYTITEVQAPEGYVTPGILGSLSSFTLNVEPVYEGTTLTGLNASVSSNIALNPSIAEDGITVDNGMINIDVTNDRVIALALTGAQGATFAGLVLVVAGVALYLYRRNKASQASEE